MRLERELIERRALRHLPRTHHRRQPSPIPTATEPGLKQPRSRPFSTLSPPSRHHALLGEEPKAKLRFSPRSHLFTSARCSFQMRAAVPAGPPCPTIVRFGPAMIIMAVTQTGSRRAVEMALSREQSVAVIAVTGVWRHGFIPVSTSEHLWCYRSGDSWP